MTKVESCGTCIFSSDTDRWTCPECLICKHLNPLEPRSMHTTREEYDNLISMTQVRQAKVITSPEFNKLCNKIWNKYKKE